MLALARLLDVVPWTGETHNERFERTAARFRTETGLVAPGKDIPSAAGTTEETEPLYRMEAWTRCHADRVREAWDVVGVESPWTTGGGAEG